jgi:hypothetical protein
VQDSLPCPLCLQDVLLLLSTSPGNAGPLLHRGQLLSRPVGVSYILVGALCLLVSATCLDPMAASSDVLLPNNNSVGSVLVGVLALQRAP